MAAGIIAYKLCDRGFRCESCPFDAVLRGSGARAPAGGEDREWTGVRQSRAAADIDALPTPELPARTAFPADRVYHPAHTWAQARDGHRIRIGIDALAARLADRITDIVLPMRGQLLERDKAGIWLLDETGILAMCMPASGIVRESNPDLHQRPWLAVDEPYGAGWLIELESTDDGALAGLLSATAMTRRAIADLASLRQRATQLAGSLRIATPGDGAVRELQTGATSFDGGELHPELRAILGAPAYHALVQPLLAPPGPGRSPITPLR
jgi:glycine cleavage system H protein